MNDDDTTTSMMIQPKRNASSVTQQAEGMMKTEEDTSTTTSGLSSTAIPNVARNSNNNHNSNVLSNSITSSTSTTTTAKTKIGLIGLSHCVLDASSSHPDDDGDASTVIPNSKRQRSNHPMVPVVEDDDDSPSSSSILAEEDEQYKQEEYNRMYERLTKLGLDIQGQPLDNYSLLDFPVREWKFVLPGTQSPVALNPMVTLTSLFLLWSMILWFTAYPESSHETIIAGRQHVVLHWSWFFQITKSLYLLTVLYVTYHYGHLHFVGKPPSPQQCSREQQRVFPLPREHSNSNNLPDHDDDDNHNDDDDNVNNDAGDDRHNHHHHDNNIGMHMHNNNSNGTTGTGTNTENESDEDEHNNNHNEEFTVNMKPEFSSITYFAMIFAAVTCPGLLIYGVQEPLWHNLGGSFFTATGYRSQDEIDMFAINMTVTNWGITLWIQYTLVAICTCLAGYTFHLPLTFRSCFYPILRDYTWGWMGDTMDIVAIVVTVAGVCTTLALAVMQIVNGLLYKGWIDPYSRPYHIKSIQITTIWVITLLSTASVISGLRGAIRFLCIAALGMGFLLLFLVFVMDDTSYLLNLIVQETGYYLQHSILELNLWTDAFGQLREGSGRAVDGKAADPSWMDSWIVFYQAWGVTWSVIIGVFVAHISKGRKLWEVVVYCFAVPLSYCLIWFCIWGGIALRQLRQSMELSVLGATYFNDSQHFLSAGSEICYDVPQENVVINGETVFHNYLPGVTPVCQFDPSNGNMAVFNVLYSFSFPDTFGNNVGLGPYLSIFFMIACVVLYMASADAASLIVDVVACNGRKNNHWARRMLWAITIGALTTVLVLSDNDHNHPVYAIEGAAIITSLPLVVLLCFTIQSTLRLCHVANTLHINNNNTSTNNNERGGGDGGSGNKVVDSLFPKRPEFDMPLYGGIFNVTEFVFSAGHVNSARVDAGMDRPTFAQIYEFGKGLILPFVSLHRILHYMFPRNPITNALYVMAYALCYISWVVMLGLSWQRRPGLRGLMWVSFVLSGLLLGKIRSIFRERHDHLRSNLVADYVGSWLLWPQVLTQLSLQLQQHQRRQQQQQQQQQSPQRLEHNDIG